MAHVSLSQIQNKLDICHKLHHTGTYPSNHLKVILPVEINSFAVEKPLEDGAEGRITGNLTGQHQTLSHRSV